MTYNQILDTVAKAIKQWGHVPHVRKHAENTIRFLANGDDLVLEAFRFGVGLV